MSNSSRPKALLLLEDGTLIEGKAIGRIGTHGGEICFNTGMTGYQEIYTDPSYYGQIIVNTTSHIGNYGVLNEEQESEAPKIAGLVVNRFSHNFSRKTADESLQDYLDKHGIVGIAELDTRMLVRHIRDKGAMNAIISSEITDPTELKKALDKVPSMDGLELSSKVCTQEPFVVGQGNTYKVAVLDLGIKNSILDNFTSRGCECKVFPAKTPFAQIQAYAPHGYFISNGPGDPAAMDYAVETVKQILDTNKPVFGICLGHQILARACQVGTYKMHHGHRGLNHPIRNLETGLCEVTSQNHGFGVVRQEVENSEVLTETHVHLNDHTVAGLRHKEKPAFSVQYHPEASPGPHDSRYLFDDFITMLAASQA